MSKLDISKLSRRQMIKLGLLSGAAMFGPRLTWAQTCSGFIDQTPQDIDLVTGLTANEVFPTSPFILSPFTDPLPIPEAMLPGYRQPDGTLTPNASRCLDGADVGIRKQSRPSAQSAARPAGRNGSTGPHSRSTRSRCS